MEKIGTLLKALWEQDFQTLANPDLVFMLYAVLFVVLVLENGILPATFLPGDSLLLLAGTLIVHGIADYWITLAVLTVGAALGSEVGYWQGRWLSESRVVKRWMSHIPQKYHDKTERMLHKYGILALLLARFTAFVRTLMPLFIGVSGMERRVFHVVNWVSGVLWVGLLITLSYFAGQTEFFRNHQEDVMRILTIIPVVLIGFGILTSFYFVWKSKREREAAAKQATTNP